MNDYNTDSRICIARSYLFIYHFRYGQIWPYFLIEF